MSFIQVENFFWAEALFFRSIQRPRAKARD